MFSVLLIDDIDAKVTLKLTNKIANIKIHHRDYKAFVTEDIITALTDDCLSVVIGYDTSQYALG